MHVYIYICLCPAYALSDTALVHYSIHTIVGNVQLSLQTYLNSVSHLRYTFLTGTCPTMGLKYLAPATSLLLIHLNTIAVPLL